MIDFPTAQKAGELLTRVRERRPRVHCLMNTVVQKFTADGITAVGGIPSMTSSPEEIEDFVLMVDALTINLGTLDEARRKVIRQAVAIANAKGKPWIIDPVHCDYSPSRLAFAREMLALGPAIVRGNQAEMSVIGDVAKALRIQTGPQDLLQDQNRAATIHNGHPWMAKVTGTGCLSGGVIAAFMAVETDPVLAAAAALTATGVSAEIAARHSRGPGTFEAAFLDALNGLSTDEIVSFARIERHEN
ncbi:hydroxyethylthiazole kinase [Agrobacterium sp. fls2-241-TYG-188a]|jgi:hydroxyethylthiazole kinase|uniref:hydroxyethylthiazole kinase n=1 Tax=Agrobacterium sp. fls2-241-TYG-188a TaxID=3040275 RepID=UPI0025517EC2|nr:hydroxyethylthiazole kinase [Agrobacterium sp. fls2-241-TYG-188a]